ncbi:hypothetical protein [Faecalispora anaeroviscerum]|uniref:hypothetical protein n=1 Tax=Faecalispora anaeroviscerum TaxID=2991836 RepID=UPI0024B97E04|nr:hypothetical protein [Faecalispora anaeroviscerum]
MKTRGLLFRVFFFENGPSFPLSYIRRRTARESLCSAGGFSRKNGTPTILRPHIPESLLDKKILSNYNGLKCKICAFKTDAEILIKGTGNNEKAKKKTKKVGCIATGCGRFSDCGICAAKWR